MALLADPSLSAIAPDESLWGLPSLVPSDLERNAATETAVAAAEATTDATTASNKEQAMHPLGGVGWNPQMYNVSRYFKCWIRCYCSHFLFFMQDLTMLVHLLLKAQLQPHVARLLWC